MEGVLVPVGSKSPRMIPCIGFQIQSGQKSRRLKMSYTGHLGQERKGSRRLEDLPWSIIDELEVFFGPGVPGGHTSSSPPALPT